MIGVIGAGKLGEILASQLCEDFYKTNTSQNPSSIIFDINSSSLSSLPETEIFIICVPPSKIHLNKGRAFLESINNKRVIFISSTSVFGKTTGQVIESSPRFAPTENSKKLIEFEDIVLSNNQGTVIRPSGLYCQNSHPGRFLSGKKDIKNPDHPISLISRCFVAKTILKLLRDNSLKSLNLANANHPSKSDYYTQYCIRNKLAPPIFSNINDQYNKTISTKHKLFIDYSALP